jgi:hypothetical protein
MAIYRSIEPDNQFAILILLAVKRVLKRQFHACDLSYTPNHLLRCCFLARLRLGFVTAKAEKPLLLALVERTRFRKPLSQARHGTAGQ